MRRHSSSVAFSGSQGSSDARRTLAIQLRTVCGENGAQSGYSTSSTRAIAVG